MHIMPKQLASGPSILIGMLGHDPACIQYGSSIAIDTSGLASDTSMQDNCDVVHPHPSSDDLAGYLIVRLAKLLAAARNAHADSMTSSPLSALNSMHLHHRLEP